MLEARNLRKVYTPKKGVPVTALDGVSLKFPERGMVFLLGKSGSGKSTLLNLLGGLDKYDGGEIIIKGESSKNFSQTHFDSYRNTYVGFIFQEYNVLDEFTVGANIALALELQGKKATDAEINRILDQVDLVGYGQRKPNELSGGQLQRVAIARALVKNPEIIMADEPTGALDSATGKQVFDTLKKLSTDKLVIIVSHDREYAEHYADRIIELADGKVIGDVEYEPEEDGVGYITYDGDTVTIPKDYHLTEEDRVAINEYIDRIKDGTKLHFSGLGKKFRETDESRIPDADRSTFKLIKSKLPMKSAFRIGGSSLGHKKFRLMVTIFLSVVAFTLFALVDTFGAYNHAETMANSIADTGIKYASMKKNKYIDNGPLDSYWRTWGYKISDEDVAEINKNSGITVKGVYVPSDYSIDFAPHTNTDVELYTENEEQMMINIFEFGGFTEVTEDDIKSFGYKIAAGRLPDGGKDEIAISEYVLETFKIGGYMSGETEEVNGVLKYKEEKINTADDMVGKTLVIGGVRYTVTGVVDTGFDLSRYEILKESAERDSTADQLVKYFLGNELLMAQRYSLASLIMVGEGTISRLTAGEPVTVPLQGSYMWLYSNDDADSYVNIDPYRIGNIGDIDTSKVVWRDGEKRTSLGEGEIIIATDTIYSDAILGITAGDMTFGEGDDTVIIEDEAEKKADYGTVFERTFSGTYDCSFGYSSFNDWVVVGYVDAEAYPDVSQSIYVNDEFYTLMTDGIKGNYEFAVGVMPEGRGEIFDLVKYSIGNEDTTVRYALQNPVSYELETVNEALVILADVFIWIGIGFAVFAAIMLANFIATSIAYKKQEIGILRAIGSRSNDVFRIFFSESFIIAMINFVLSAAATFAVTLFINEFVIRQQCGLLITVLTFDFRQIALLFVISVGIAAAASYLPVKKIASKRPIDAIRGR